MSGQSCSPDFPFEPLPEAEPTPLDDVPASFAAMNEAAESATTLEPITSCRKPYLEVSFFDDESGSPISGNLLKLELGDKSDERPLDGSAVYRVDDTKTNLETLVPVVYAELDEEGGVSWRVEVGRDLTPMEEGPHQPPLRSAEVPPMPWEPFGELPAFDDDPATE
jgi:hypothetical protein